MKDRCDCGAVLDVEDASGPLDDATFVAYRNGFTCESCGHPTCSACGAKNDAMACALCEIVRLVIA